MKERLKLLFALFLFLPIFACGPKIYIQVPKCSPTTETSEIIHEENEEGYEEHDQGSDYYGRRPSNNRNSETRNFDSWYRGLRFGIRQGIGNMAEKLDMDEAELADAYYQAILAKSEQDRPTIFRDICLFPVLENDGSISRISKRYRSVSGWNYEAEVSEGMLEIFIPANRSFAFGITDQSRFQDEPYSSRDNQNLSGEEKWKFKDPQPKTSPPSPKKNSTPRNSKEKWIFKD